MFKNDWVRTLLILGAATLLTFGLKKLGIGRESLLMVYIVGVICCAAVTHGYLYSMLCAVFSMLLFNYFNTEPVQTFAISSENDATMLVFFLITGFISAAMTARFREALRTSQENERRAEQFYKEKEGAKLEAEQAKLKSDLLRSIGHDLRTPLTGIQCGTSYLAEHAAALSAEEVAKMASDLNEQTAWLSTLVENTLYMTRIDNDRLEVAKQPEVVDDVVSEAVSHVPALEARRLSVVLPESVVTVPMDGKMIVQVLVNLLENAVRQTPPTCPIRVSVKPGETDAVFCVEDGGPGIPEDQREKIFGSFVTSGKSGPDGRKGLGLGLAICRAIVRAHGGHISVGASDLGGAAFTFSLPMEEPPL